MKNEFSRTTRLLGKPAMDRLLHSHVAVFGVGGVGTYCIEALARSGIGTFSLFDHDTVDITNINRQLIATHKTLGQKKVDVMAERIISIHPAAIVLRHPIFYCADDAETIDFSSYDYIVDAIDTISAKISLIEQAYRHHVPIISAMGAGNKLDPTQFEVADIYETSICPLARVMRRELRQRNIPALKVVYSKETPLVPQADESPESAPPGRRAVPGSAAFVPSVAGLIMASEIVKDIGALPQTPAKG